MPPSRSRPNPIIPVTALLFQTELESDPDKLPDDTARVAPAESLRLRDAVHAHIRFVLRHTQGNKRRAARELGVGARNARTEAARDEQRWRPPPG